MPEAGSQMFEGTLITTPSGTAAPVKDRFQGRPTNFHAWGSFAARQRLRYARDPKRFGFWFFRSTAAYLISFYPHFCSHHPVPRPASDEHQIGQYDLTYPRVPYNTKALLEISAQHVSLILCSPSSQPLAPSAYIVE